MAYIQIREHERKQFALLGREQYLRRLEEMRALLRSQTLKPNRVKRLKLRVKAAEFLLIGYALVNRV